MKITASRRDDIIRERDQFDADAKARKLEEEKEYSNWRNAADNVLTSVSDAVKADLPKTTLPIEVTARIGLRDSIEVTISNHRHDPYAKGNALAWDWSVRLNQEGQVIKESNSWSGLKATTIEEIDSLEESIKVLKACNNLDWPSILAVSLPQWDDYAQNRGPRPQRPDFESQLIEAEIEELVGSDTLIEGQAGEGSPYRPGVDVYYLIHKESPKQYSVSCAYKGSVDQWIADGKDKEAILEAIRNYPFRINKAKFFQLIGKEVKTVTL